MVSVGSKTLQRKVSRNRNLVETCHMTREDASSEQEEIRRMKKKNGPRKVSSGPGEPDPSCQTSGKPTSLSRHDGAKTKKRSLKHGKGQRASDKNVMKVETFSKDHERASQPSVLRKKVDPATAKYFLEISNLFESNGVDLEERPFICANALDETRGKELELATDMVISRTLQTLLEGCDLDQLCSFLQSCAKDFSSIAMDKNGSHVAESALKSLAIHLQDQDTFYFVENVLRKICQVVVVDPVSIMCSSYGSHVIRRLLCLCKGVPLDSVEEFHVTKVSTVLAERLNIKMPQASSDNANTSKQGFPDLLKFLIEELLNHAGPEVTTIRANKYGSFVLQTALKLLVGNDQELMDVILTILGCSKNFFTEGISLEAAKMQEIMNLLKDNASSHLFEAMLEVAPANLYQEILEKVFKGSLFEISCHQCGNFVVQALISSARCKGQVDILWEELGVKIKELLAIGKSGVVASLLAACQRFQTLQHECCKVLASAVCSESEHPSCIIPHLLFLENYVCCSEISDWKWPTGFKMHLLGCLMLQTVFKYPKKYMKSYIKSMVSIESDQILEIARDSGGSRVLESFLISDASPKEKLEVVSKLQGHFGELSLHPSGSFTVEKCFTASNLTFKETIVSELASIKANLSKTKHGPYILKKLDVDGYVMQPKHWKSSRAAKEAVYRDFHSAFVPNSNPQGSVHAAKSSQAVHDKRETRFKSAKTENDNCTSDFSSPLGPDFPGLEAAMGKLGFAGFKHGLKRSRDADKATIVSERPRKKFVGSSTATSFVRQGGKRKSRSSELADLAGKGALSAGDVRQLFKGITPDPVKQSVNKKSHFARHNR